MAQTTTTVFKGAHKVPHMLAVAGVHGRPEFAGVVHLLPECDADNKTLSFLNFRQELIARARGQDALAAHYSGVPLRPAAEAAAPAAEGPGFKGLLGAVVETARRKQARSEPMSREALEGFHTRLRVQAEAEYTALVGKASIIKGNAQVTLSAADAALQMKVFDAQWAQIQNVLEGRAIAPERFNLETPERQLLWAAALLHRHHPNSMRAPGAHEYNNDPMVDAVLKTPMMTDARGTLSHYAKGVLPLSVGNHQQMQISYGPPGSWFYCTMPTEKQKHRNINIDLFFSLVAGMSRTVTAAGDGNRANAMVVRGNFQMLGYHEIGHALLSHEYPSMLQELHAKEEELKKRIKEKENKLPPAPSGVGHAPEAVEGLREDMRELMEVSMRAQLIHGVWNAAEDITVNRYAVSLSDPAMLRKQKDGGGFKGKMDRHTIHPANQAHGANVTTALLCGHADLVSQYLHPALCAAENEKADPASPEARLSDLEMFTDMTFFLHDPHRRDDTLRFMPDAPETWKILGVHPELMVSEDGKDKEYLHGLCRKLDNLYPQDTDGRWLDGVEIRDAYVDYFHAQKNPDREQGKREIDANPIIVSNRERNKVIEEIITLYALPHIDKIVQKNAGKATNKALQQMQEGKMLQDMIEQGLITPVPGSPQEGGTPGQGQGYQPPLPSPEGKGPPHSVTISDASKDFDNGRLKGEGAQPSEPGENKPAPQPMADKPVAAAGLGGKNAVAHSPGGKGAAFLDDVKFDDGSSYREFQKTPGYTMAKAMLSDRFVKIAEMSRTEVAHLGQVGTRYVPLPGVTISQSRDIEKVNRLQTRGAQSADDFRIEKGLNVKTVPAITDVVVVIDGSGSMGIGTDATSVDGKTHASRMEVAAKLTALLYDSEKEAERKLCKKTGVLTPRYRMFSAIFGDNAHWAKEHKKLVDKYRVIEPSMSHDQVARHIEAAIAGRGTGTQLAPAFPNLVDRMLDRENDTLANSDRMAPTRGIVISDGGIADPAQTKRRILTTLKAMPNMTLDVFIIGSDRENALSPLIREIGQMSGMRDRVSVTEMTKAREMPKLVVEMLEKRVIKTSEKEPIPYKIKGQPCYVENLKRAVYQYVADERSKGGGARQWREAVALPGTGPSTQIT